MLSLAAVIATGGRWALGPAGKACDLAGSILAEGEQNREGFGQMILPTAFGLCSHDLCARRGSGIGHCDVSRWLNVCLRRRTLRTERCGAAHRPRPRRREAEALAVTSYVRARSSGVVRGASDLGGHGAPALHTYSRQVRPARGWGLVPVGGTSAVAWSQLHCPSGDKCRGRYEGPGQPVLGPALPGPWLSLVTLTATRGLQLVDPPSSCSPVSWEPHPIKLLGWWG